MDQLTELLNKSKDKSELKLEDEILLQPYHHISQNYNTGNDLLSIMAAAFNRWMNIPDDKFKAILEIVKLLRDSSLLIDDIQGSSCLRRGEPVAHSVYGIAHTMNAANYAYFLSLEKAFELNHSEAVTIVNEQMLEMHRGQGMDVYWRDRFVCPTEDEYKQMVIQKSGSMFFLIVRLMQLYSTDKRDFTKLTTILTLYYQIREDYCNLVCNKYAERKGFCDDITEGKYSFPIIYAINIDQTNQTVHDILRQRTTDIDIQKKCLHTMNNLGSFVYTQQVMENLDKEARFEVHDLGANVQINELLDQLRSCHMEL